MSDTKRSHASTTQAQRHGMKRHGMNRRGFIKTAGVAGGALALTSVGAPHVRAQATKVKVGQIAPMTGSAAEFGPFYRDGARLAINQINEAAKEVFGQEIISQHILEDTNTLPTPAIESARKLVEADGVPAIIGAWSSGVTVATSTSVSIPNGVLQISNGSTSPLISVLPEDAQSDLLFRTTSSDALQGVVAAQLAAGEIMDDYSNKTEEVQPSYMSQLAVALKVDPDILVCCSYPGHTATFLKEARDVFGFTNWQFVDGNKSDKVLNAVGGGDLAGKMGTAPGSDPSLPAYQNFESAFKSAYDHDRIVPFTNSAYDAGAAIGLAVARAIAEGASELDGRTIRDNLRPVANPDGARVDGGKPENFVKAMEMLRNGESINYSGAAGACDFDDNGDVKTPIALWRFTKDGTKTVQIQSATDIPSE